jgi:hypothetical protein
MVILDMRHRLRVTAGGNRHEGGMEMGVTVGAEDNG